MIMNICNLTIANIATSRAAPEVKSTHSCKGNLLKRVSHDASNHFGALAKYSPKPVLISGDYIPRDYSDF